MKNKDLEDLKMKLAKFAQDRDWDKFHSPKNLVMALAGESGELVELFQWLTESDSQNLSDKQKHKVEEEIADIFLYLLRLSAKLDIDLIEAAYSKILINEVKYPIERCYGLSNKYTDL